MKKIRTIQAAVLEEKKLKVCEYVRVSTDQAEQKNSFSAQVEHYTAYIKNNPTWNFAGIYSDNALSGKNAAKRPEFMRMVTTDNGWVCVSDIVHWNLTFVSLLLEIFSDRLLEERIPNILLILYDISNR